MASTGGGNNNQITGINVTPLVDIMLVLLIIFMVTATYIIKEAFEIELPKAAAAGQTTGKTLAIVITKDGTLYLDGQPATEKSISEKVEQSKEPREKMQAVISADKNSLHGSVVQILDLLKGLGVTKFAIEIEKQQAAAETQ